MKEITYEELEAMTDTPPLRIDVREASEHQEYNLGGINIPLSTLAENIHKIPQDIPVVLYCRTGSRSHYAIQALTHAGWNNLINLRGGVMMAQQ